MAAWVSETQARGASFHYPAHPPILNLLQYELLHFFPRVAAGPYNLERIITCRLHVGQLEVHNKNIICTGPPLFGSEAVARGNRITQDYTSCDRKIPGLILNLL